MRALRAIGFEQGAEAIEEASRLIHPTGASIEREERIAQYARLSERAEGHISNFERLIDGFLAGLPYERLLPALRKINVNPLDRPIVDIGI